MVPDAPLTPPLQHGGSPDSGATGSFSEGLKGLKWYVLRCQLKREALAAAAIRQRGIAEILNPRIRFQRATRRGKVWFVEALFPGYLFARFSEEHDLRRILAAPGVSGVVQFGQVRAALDEATIGELRKLTTEDELILIEPPLEPGSTVNVTHGPFAGIEGIVREYRPAKERVKILLDFLGQQVVAEVNISTVQSPEHPRTHLLQRSL